MKIIECPRDAMQGLTDFIPTDVKISYLNQLLKVGFDTLDFGSFVSAKAIPQLRDTADVYASLDWQSSKTKLLAIVANTRGAETAASMEGIRYLGYPISISETFQQRNTNRSIDDAFITLDEIQKICSDTGKELVAYISMGFGNPYGDPFDIHHVANFVSRVSTVGASVIALSDTIGVSTPENISFLVENISNQFPSIEVGVHLHATPHTTEEKVVAAWQAGCNRFDGAIRGFGGCPMANDDLVGNLATETIAAVLAQKHVSTGLDMENFSTAIKMADEIFPKH